MGKYVLPMDTSKRSEAQAILSPKAGEEIRDWALLHWQKNDTNSSSQVRQFAALVASNQGLLFKSQGWLAFQWVVGWILAAPPRSFLPGHPSNGILAP